MVTYLVKSVLSRYNEEALSKFNPDGDFERPITREEVAQIIHNSLFGRVELTQEMKNYDDITTVNNYEAIEFCTRAGILTGYPDNTIRPQGELTRVEFMTILAKIDSLLNK